jgi:preprotein translocase subunit Sec61beta
MGKTWGKKIKITTYIVVTVCIIVLDLM